MLFNLKISQRIIVVVVLCTIPSIFLAIFNAYVNYRTFLDDANQNAGYFADQLAQQHLMQIQSGEDTLSILATFSEIQNPIYSGCQILVERQVKLSQTFSNIGVPLSNGDLLCNGTPLSKAVNVADRPYIQTAIKTKKVSVSKLLVDRTQGQYSINIAYPIVDKSDEVVALVVGVMPLSWWKKSLQTFNFGDTEVTSFVTDSDQRVISSYGLNGPDIGETFNWNEYTRGEASESSHQVSLEDYVIAKRSVKLGESSINGYLTYWIALPKKEGYEAAIAKLWEDSGLVVLVLITSLLLLWFSANVLFVGPFRRLATEIFSANSEDKQEHHNISIDDLNESIQNIVKHQKVTSASLSNTESQLVMAYKKQELLLNSAPIGYIELDVNNVILTWSDRCEAFFHMTEEAARGVSIWDLQRAAIDTQYNDLSGLISALKSDNDDGPIVTNSRSFIAPEMAPTQYYFQWNLSKLTGPTGGVATILTVENVTEQQIQKQVLSERASNDWLTKLPNRYAIIESIEQLIQNPKTYRFALVLFDLNGFKYINDNFGHDVGDDLLVNVSDRMKSLLLKGEMIARLGGDEFLLLLNSETSEVSLLERANILYRAFFKPIEVSQRTFRFSASAGVAVFPQDGMEAKSLIKRADIAMYRAKEEKRSSCVLYSIEMEEGGRRRYELETDLRNAIDSGQLTVHYQPIVDSKNGEVVSIEALVRWEHLPKKFVPPDVFIPIAEDVGLISDIGQFVIDQVICDMDLLSEQFGQSIHVSVNLSPNQLTDSELTDYLMTLVKTDPDKAKRLVLEITESVFIDDRSVSRVELLRDLGFLISLDDFGTGFSSLSHISRMPIDILKIDRSFVNRMFDSDRDQKLLKNIVIMSKDLNLKIVAEGVETEEQKALLAGIGCDSLQGFLFYRPANVETLIKQESDH